MAMMALGGILRLFHSARQYNFRPMKMKAFLIALSSLMVFAPAMVRAESWLSCSGLDLPSSYKGREIAGIPRPRGEGLAVYFQKRFHAGFFPETRKRFQRSRRFRPR
jgi:hypothetical protein